MYIFFMYEKYFAKRCDSTGVLHKFRPDLHLAYTHRPKIE